MKPAISLLALLAASPAFADSTRELDAHVHGVGELNIAIDGTTVAMEFHAPGADIVGFEYEATSDEDLAAIEAAIGTLSDPLSLFGWPEAAGCSVISASAELETEEEHDNHDHEEDDHHDHDHDKEDDHEHDHDDHEEGHDDHDHDKDDDHADHDDHDEHDHAEEASHTEFHAEYTLDCANPDALTELTFPYFDTFENALEVEVQIITASGASAFEVERDVPTLDLSSAF